MPSIRERSGFEETGTRSNRGSFPAVLLTGLLLLSVAAAGCRPAERVAWAADAHGLALLAGPGLAAPADAARREKGFALYLSGVLAETSADFKTALEQYRLAHSEDPQSPQILLRQGLVQLQLNDIPAAEIALAEASRLDPADPRPLFVLGVLYAQQERFEEAARQYAQVLAHDPANLGALSQLAELYVLQEKIQEGLSTYERLLKERPDSPVLHFTIGVLYAKAEQWEDAIRSLRRAVELDSGYLEARLALAVSLELGGRVDEARNEFLNALKLEPANTTLIYYLAQISRRLGDLDQTAEWLGRYLSFKPRDPEAHLELALVRIEQGRWQEAVETLRAVLDSRSSGLVTAQFWMVLGMAYESGRQFEAAEEAYGQAARSAPQAVEPLLHLIALLHREGKLEEAQQAGQKALEIEPDHPEVLNSLGFLYADMGIHLEEAVKLIERALSQDPRNAAYLDSLGWAYFKMDRLDEAIPLLEEAVRLDADGEILDHLGQVYWKAGKESEAEAAFKRGLVLETKDQDIIHRLKSHLDGLHSIQRKD
ncbi:MAG: tetratricopeptide repeat protein [Candidatus Omnitrophica bacterium]|nr:tetratricopeptide repeat protein [Candidatus Omnitrophota bacterium]